MNLFFSYVFVSNQCSFLRAPVCLFSRLHEMGKFQEPQKETEAYAPGQVLASSQYYQLLIFSLLAY